MIKKIWQMALIDLKKIYRGTALGCLWLIAKPAVTIFVYWFAFAIGLRVGSDINGIPYFIWLIAGLLPWMYISDVISIGPDSFRKYAYLVNKIKFPTNIIPTFLSLARLIVNLLLTVIILIIYFVVCKNFDIYLIQLPIYTFLMFVHFSALSKIFACLGTFSKDFSNLIKTLPMPLLFLSTIFYSIDSIKINWIKQLQLINPISYIVNGYRNVFVYKVWIWDDLMSLLIFIIITLLLMIIGDVLYKKIHRELPDYL